MNLGKKILTLRKQKGITQEEMAAALGVTAAAVSKWENTFPTVKDTPRNSRLRSLFTTRKGEQAHETDHLRIQHGQRLRGVAF